MYHRLSDAGRLDFASRYNFGRFHIGNESYFNHAELPFNADDSIFVLEHLSFGDNEEVLAHSLQGGLADWEDAWPQQATEPRERAARLDAGAKADAIERHPWAAEYLAPKTHESRRGGNVRKPCVDEEILPPDVDLEDVLDTALSDLYDDIVAGDHDAEPGGEDFFTRVRGIRLGVIGDIVAGTVGAEAKRGVPREFCSRYSLHDSSSWSVRLYTHDVAMELAHEWCSKNQFLYDMWVAAGDAYYRFPGDIATLYEASDDWRRFVEALPLASLALERARLIEVMQPINP
jgi:hypothetical protein